MKYSLVTVINGNFKVEAEYQENKQGAFVGFHNKAATLWNASDVITAMVKVVDENLDCVEGKMEYINHVQPDPEPEPEADTE
jgi:hypothetical protein